MATFEEGISDTVAHGAAFDPLAGVSARDGRDGDVTARVSVLGTVDTSSAGRYQLLYLVSDAAGNQSAVSRRVTVEQPPLPVNTARPAVNGTPAVGNVVTADQGRWSNASGARFELQWLRDGAPVAGATRGEYTVTGADVGARLSVRVTARVEGREAVVATSAEATVGTVRPEVRLKVRKKIQAGRRVSARIAFTVPGSVPTGTVVVSVGSRTVDAVSLRADGTAKVRLPRLAPGRHRVKVVLQPGEGYARAKAVRTIRVRR